MVSKRWGDIERRRPNDRILGLIKIRYGSLSGRKVTKFKKGNQGNQGN